MRPDGSGQTAGASPGTFSFRVGDDCGFHKTAGKPGAVARVYFPAVAYSSCLYQNSRPGAGYVKTFCLEKRGNRIGIGRTGTQGFSRPTKTGESVGVRQVPRTTSGKRVSPGRR